MLTYGQINAQFKSRSDLHTRQDNDRDMYYLKDYSLTDNDDKPLSGVLSLTLNLPALFAGHVMSSLMGAEEQMVISAKKKDSDWTATREKILTALVEQAHRRNARLGRFDLLGFDAEKVTIRGEVVHRLNFIRDGNTLICDILPMDPRYFAHEMGPKGMKWGAYATFRSMAQVKAEYPNIVLKKQSIFAGIRNMFGSNQTVDKWEVIEAWDEEQKMLFVNGELAENMTEKNPHGYPPYTYRRVPLGSMLGDATALAHQSESIFFLMRKQVPELNRLVSIMQTQNIKTIKPPMQYHAKRGIMAPIPTNATNIGATSAVEIDGGFERIETGDMTQGISFLYGVLSSLIQAASRSITGYGELGGQNLSAVALVQLEGGSNEVILPRLGTLGLIRQDDAEMIARQVQATGLTQVELGSRGNAQIYSVSDLSGEYDITYSYAPSSPQLDIARYAIMDQADKYMPREMSLEKVMHAQNPAEIIRLKRIEEAEEWSEAVKVRRIVSDLIEEGRFEEAELMTAEWEERIGGAEDEGPPALTDGSENGVEPARNLRPLVSGTRQSSNKQASQLPGSTTQPILAET